MSTRVLGSFMIIGSLAVALDSFRASDSFDLISSIALILWCIGGVFGTHRHVAIERIGAESGGTGIWLSSDIRIRYNPFVE